MFKALAIHLNLRANTYRQILYLSVGIGTVVLIGWKFSLTLNSYSQLSKGHTFLKDALKMIGNEYIGPDYCFEGDTPNENANNLVNKAKDSLQAAHRAMPNNAQALLLLGRAECLQGNLDAAIQAYKGYTKLRPDNPLGHLELGFAYEKRDLFEEAIQEWKLAGVTSKDFFSLGQREQAAGADGLLFAVKWFERASYMDPGWSQPYYQLAVVYCQLSEFSNAIRILDKGIEESQTSFGISNLYYQKGFILQYNLNPVNLTGAWEMYQSALNINNFSLVPSHFAAIHHHRGSILTAHNRLEEAIEEFKKAIQLDKYQYWAHLGLANALWLTGDQEQAIALTQKATSLNQDPSLAYVYLGDFYFAQGLLDDAQEMYLKALEYSPKFSRALEGIEKIEENP